MDASSLESLQPEDIRQERLRREREYLLSDEGFLDFVRDSGAAPDAELQPHGRYCQDLITWNGEVDPDAPDRVIYTWKVTLWPRGSFKSQVFNVGQVAWLIAKDPDVRVLVCSETARQARKFVGEVMKIVESEWFRERFGNHKGKDWRPGSGTFTSALRTRKGVKDPTLQASGVGEVQTGAHWDFVLMDDVCSQENTKTPESIESLWHWFGETLAQLDPGCKLFIIGTLHHYADIYCRIQKDPEIRKLFEFSVHAWRDPSGELFFPTRLTEKFVMQQKAIMPPRLFACFYENKPTTAEEQLFRPEYFRVIEDESVPQHLWAYIFTDFAFIAEEKKKGKADRTAFWVVGLDCNRVAYVLDFYVGRWKPSDSVRIACDLWNRYQWANLKGLVIEKTTHAELLQSLFEQIRMETFIRPRMIEIAGRNQETKDMRIESAEPRFRSGDIYFTRSLQQHRRKWKPLVEEMTEWPFSAHDDIPDAISDIDKRTPEGDLYCPGPPSGWRNQPIQRHQPGLIDGAYNPDYGYPARENIRAEDLHQHDLWRSASSTASEPTSAGQPKHSNNVFQRQPQQPKGWPNS